MKSLPTQTQRLTEPMTLVVISNLPTLLSLLIKGDQILGIVLHWVASVHVSCIVKFTLKPDMLIAIPTVTSQEQTPPISNVLFSKLVQACVFEN